MLFFLWFRIRFSEKVAARGGHHPWLLQLTISGRRFTKVLFVSQPGMVLVLLGRRRFF